MRSEGVDVDDVRCVVYAVLDPIAVWKVVLKISETLIRAAKLFRFSRDSLQRSEWQELVQDLLRLGFSVPRQSLKALSGLLVKFDRLARSQLATFHSS